MIINEETKHAIIGGLFILFFTLFIGASVCLFSTTRELNQTRGLNDQLRERVAEAEDTNRELTRSLGQIRFLCGEFDSSVDRNIRTVREAISVIEETRYYVQCIEVELGLWDSDSIYDRYDNYVFGTEIGENINGNQK